MCQLLFCPILWEEILINIGEIGIGKDHVRVQAGSIHKENVTGVRRIRGNLFHGGVKDEFHTGLPGKLW